ncbi:MAG TPA: UbiA family prenyltransferase [Rhodothermales bacterium]
MSFRDTIRVDAWWIFKIGPVLAFAFAEVALHGIQPVPALILVVSLMVSAFGIAAFGHVVNDAFDVAADARAGKANALGRRSPTRRALLTLALLGLGFLPWTLIEVSTAAMVILATNAALLVAYAAPPLRLKERGFAGVIADAAYAHLLPVLFILALFDGAVLPTPIGVAWYVGAAGWALCFGVRGIVLHQTWDQENDLRAGVRTFVTDRGPTAARQLIHRFAYPGELFFLGVMGVVFFLQLPLAFWILVLYAAAWWTGRALGVFPRSVSLDPLPKNEGEHVPLACFYSLWPALAVAVALSFAAPMYGILLIVMLVLFPGHVSGEMARCAHLLGGIGYQGYWAIRKSMQSHAARSRETSRRMTMNPAQLPGAENGERDS